MNNRERKAKAARERMEPVTYVRCKNASGNTCVYPMRFLVPDERRAYLARSPSAL